MTKFRATYNDGFTWQSRDGIFVKGYAFDADQNYYEGNSLIDHFKKAESIGELKELTNSLNGLFCAMGDLSWGKFALSDKCRTFPLFFTRVNNEITISDNPNNLIEQNKIRKDSVSSYLATGYVIGNKTLFDGVVPIPCSSILTIIENQPSTIEYYTFSTQEVDHNSFEGAAKQLHSVLEAAMTRMAKSIENRNRPLAVPLSGGYDSRFILTWLVNHGHKNITAFSYGKENNNDLRTAEKVAKVLGVRWIPIVYSNEMIDGFNNEPNFLPFCHYISAATSMPILQDYFAVREIVKRGLLSSDAIIIPGHSGDFIAGSHISPHAGGISSTCEIVDEIYKHHFNIIPLPKQQEHYEKQRLREDTIRKHEIPFTIIEAFNFRERQAKFIINASRAYSYFGFEFRLPLWDSELVDLFKSQPFNYRIKKKLYNEVLLTHYFKPMQLSFAEDFNIDNTNGLLFKTRKLVKRIIPYWLLKLKPMPDNLNYTFITKTLLNSPSMHKPADLGRSINAGITYWYYQVLLQLTNEKRQNDESNH